MRYPTEENPLRVVELFAGIGSQRMALEILGIPHKVVAISEIDRFALRSYEAIHGDCPNLGDITKVEALPECDLLTYSFPCTDLSIAGKQKGMERGSGTHSSLLWEVGRLLRTASDKGILPDTLLMENVDAILSNPNVSAFNDWISDLRDLGYTSSYSVLNASDFGVPQSRRRCFMVSSTERKELVFPFGKSMSISMENILESDVDESFYLPDSKLEGYVEREGNQSSPSNIIVDGDLSDRRIEMCNRVYSTGGMSPTLCTARGGGTVPKIRVGGGAKTGQLVITGRIPCGRKQDGEVYSIRGPCPTLRVGGNPPLVAQRRRERVH